MDRKLPLILAAPLLLVACMATGPQQGSPERGYPARGQPAPSIISDSEAEQLTEDLRSARAQRNTLVNNLPRVTDPGTRSEHIRSIQVLEEHARLMEYRLRSAGRPIPRESSSR